MRDRVKASARVQDAVMNRLFSPTTLACVFVCVSVLSNSKLALSQRLSSFATWQRKATQAERREKQ